MYIVRFDKETQINIEGRIVELFKDGEMVSYENTDASETEAVIDCIKDMLNKGYRLEDIIKE